MTTMRTTDHLRPPVRAREGAKRARRTPPAAPRTGRDPSAPRPAPFTRILVPLDLTGDSKAVIETAMLVAGSAHAEVTLLHVVPTLETAPESSYPKFYRHLALAAEKKLGAIARHFWKKHIRVREEVRIGQPLPEILGCAMAQKSDLIILRSHRFDARNPARGWATVSYRVASVCGCPVLLAK